MGIFDFLGDVGNWEERKVDHYEKGDLVVDTCFCSDTKRFETAVSHPNYNEGKWVIVEEYNTKALAQSGHNKWVKKMTGKKIPKTLRDVSTSPIASLVDAFCDDWREK